MCLRSGFRRAIESVWPAMPVPEDLHETARLLAQTSAHALPRPRPMEELRVEEEHDHRRGARRRVQLKCLTHVPQVHRPCLSLDTPHTECTSIKTSTDPSGELARESRPATMP
jgi:hypothetical protein